MKKAQWIALLVLAGLLGSIRPALANNISVTIGNPLNFTAGQHPVAVATFNGKVSGQPAPFNGFIGSNTGANFSASWTFSSYTLPTSPTITGATIAIGILDSPWEGKSGNSTPANTDQVSSFTLSGAPLPLTGLLNSEINSVGTGINTYEVDTITIPTADLATLLSGNATFTLTLQGPGNGVLGPTKSLAAGLDFSTLDITATSGSGGSPVPEPSTLSLLAAGLLGLATFALRR